MTKSQRTIREIKTLLEQSTPSTSLVELWRQDERKGVQQLIKRWDKQQAEQKRLNEQFQTMSQFERTLKSNGKKEIAGIDEVGRGPLAGPVVAAAVILSDEPIIRLNDSKLLNESVRNDLYDQIMQTASVGIGIMTSQEVDQYNIYQATKMAMVKAVQTCHSEIDHLLIDAMKLPIQISQTSLVAGDTKSVSIAAASIIAKVTRDRMMQELAITYPQYGFERNVGYGTKEHLQALKDYGVTKEHRQSFAPVAKVYQENLNKVIING